MEKLEDNVSKMEERFKLWDAKLGVLSAKADVAEAQAKIELRKRIDELKAKRATAQTKYDEYKAAGSEKWEGLKAGLEVVWNDLESAFKDLVK